MSGRILTVATLLCVAVAVSPAAAGSFPETIALPDGWQGEGIATGRGNDFFAGSRTTGAVWKGDLRSGSGEVLVEPREGGQALGLKVDDRNRLFVAGGGTGTASVYDAHDGDLLRSYALTGAPTFVNDVIVTHRAAYFTDSQRKQLYVLDLGRRGALPAGARTLPLTGDLEYDDDETTFELNGIAATRDGSRLIAVQSRTATLFLIDPRSGDTEAIDLGGATVENGDGLLLHGRTLYVVQNRSNQIAVIRLDRDLDDGRIVATLTDPDFAVPTTIAKNGGSLWAVNARFGLPPEADDERDVVRVNGR
jgi:sugar lactone lactonase YvrE